MPGPPFSDGGDGTITMRTRCKQPGPPPPHGGGRTAALAVATVAVERAVGGDDAAAGNGGTNGGASSSNESAADSILDLAETLQRYVDLAGGDDDGSTIGGGITVGDGSVASMTSAASSCRSFQKVQSQKATNIREGAVAGLRERTEIANKESTAASKQKFAAYQQYMQATGQDARDRDERNKLLVDLELQVADKVEKSSDVFGKIADDLESRVDDASVGNNSRRRPPIIVFTPKKKASKDDSGGDDVMSNVDSSRPDGDSLLLQDRRRTQDSPPNGTQATNASFSSRLDHNRGVLSKDSYDDGSDDGGDDLLDLAGHSDEEKEVHVQAPQPVLTNNHVLRLTNASVASSADRRPLTLPSQIDATPEDVSAMGTPDQTPQAKAAAPPPPPKSTPLPPGWEEHNDPATGRSYYCEVGTTNTTWNRPAMLNDNLPKPPPQQVHSATPEPPTPEEEEEEEFQPQLDEEDSSVAGLDIIKSPDAAALARQNDHETPEYDVSTPENGSSDFYVSSTSSSESGIRAMSTSKIVTRMAIFSGQQQLPPSTTGRFAHSRVDDKQAAEAVLASKDGNTIDATPSSSSLSRVPKLTKDGYVVVPSLAVLGTMSNADLAAVSGFSVSREDVGAVEWEGTVDVRDVDLDSVVSINPGSIEIYADDEKRGTKPPVGTKLNRSATITLCRVLPKGGEGASDEARSKMEKKIFKVTKEMGADLVSYNPYSGEWKFRVAHFPDDDEFKPANAKTSSKEHPPEKFTVKVKPDELSKDEEKEQASQPVPTNKHSLCQTNLSSGQRARPNLSILRNNFGNGGSLPSSGRKLATARRRVQTSASRRRSKPVLDTPASVVARRNPTKKIVTFEGGSTTTRTSSDVTTAYRTPKNSKDE